jgi:hypothetical protein
MKRPSQQIIEHPAECLAIAYDQQEAQKGRPARPQRVKTRGVPLRYVEGLNDARTKLAAFFSLLLRNVVLPPEGEIEKIPAAGIALLPN